MNSNTNNNNKITNNCIIRPETPADYRAVEELCRDAFWNLSVPGCDEHYFAHVMRSHEDFLPELTFVLELDGEIIGSIMYTRARLVDDDGNEKPVISFGPLCVAPRFQRQGCGKLLIEHSFARAVELGHDTVVIFGNPDNYVCRGFVSCKKHNVCMPGGVYPAALLVRELREGALDGKRRYYIGSTASEPCADTAAVEAFDATFPPREKCWQYSQEEFYIHSHSLLRD